MWDVEPWSGALSLDLVAAYGVLDRFAPGFDIEAVTALLGSFEAGAVKGWAKVLQARKAKA